MTVLEADYREGSGSGPLADRTFGIMFEALDDLRPDEVYPASGALLEYALWGGLMSTRAKYLNASGAILNGYVRDCDEIRKLDFPVFPAARLRRTKAWEAKSSTTACPSTSSA